MHGPLSWLRERLWDYRFRLSRQSIERLVSRGLKIGKNVIIMENVFFDSSYPWLIEIGDGCRISSDVRVMAHDATPFKDLGVTRLGMVRILPDTFIGERCIIFPGVTIGPRALIAAGSTVNRDVGEGAIVAGNPGRVVGRYDEYLERIRGEAGGARVVSLSDIETDSAVAAQVRHAIVNGETVYVKGASPGSRFHINVDDDEVHRLSRDAFDRNFGRS